MNGPCEHCETTVQSVKRNQGSQEVKSTTGVGDKIECVICTESKRPVMLLPCMHNQFCMRCIACVKNDTCPLCRQSISMIKAPGKPAVDLTTQIIKLFEQEVNDFDDTMLIVMINPFEADRQNSPKSHSAAWFNDNIDADGDQMISRFSGNWNNEQLNIHLSVHCCPISSLMYDSGVFKSAFDPDLLILSQHDREDETSTLMEDMEKFLKPSDIPVVWVLISKRRYVSVYTNPFGPEAVQDKVFSSFDGSKADDMKQLHKLLWEIAKDGRNERDPLGSPTPSMFNVPTLSFL